MSDESRKTYKPYWLIRQYKIDTILNTSHRMALSVAAAIFGIPFFINFYADPEELFHDFSERISAAFAAVFIVCLAIFGLLGPSVIALLARILDRIRYGLKNSIHKKPERFQRLLNILRIYLVCITLISGMAVVASILGRGKNWILAVASCLFVSSYLGGLCIVERWMGQMPRSRKRGSDVVT